MSLKHALIVAVTAAGGLLGLSESARADFRATASFNPAVTGSPAFFTWSTSNLGPGSPATPLPVPSVVNYNYVQVTSTTTTATNGSGTITVPFSIVFDAIQPPSTVVPPSRTVNGSATLTYSVVAGVGTISVTSYTIDGNAQPIPLGNAPQIPVSFSIGSGAFTRFVVLDQFLFSAPTIAPGTSTGSLSMRVTVTPEPSSMVLMGLGVAGLVGLGVRRARKARV
jgi:hypothetical protein